MKKPILIGVSIIIVLGILLAAAALGFADTKTKFNAFKSITERRNHALYVADSSGRNVKLIYEESRPIERATVQAVSWNPDGSKIAFSSSIANGEHVFIANPDGTERVQITACENSIPSRNEVFIAKLSGYAAKHGFKTANKSTIQEQPKQWLPEPSASTPQITKSTATAATPKASGFNAALGIIIISTIYFIKRGYN